VYLNLYYFFVLGVLDHVFILMSLVLC